MPQERREIGTDHSCAEELAARVRIDLAYVGTNFHGWQQQPGLRTVQGELGAILTRLLGRRISLTGAGRTDAGVHARGQVCHVPVESQDEAARLQQSLPRLTTADMQILAVQMVSSAFEARFSAVSRRYSYHLRFARDIFRPQTAWEVDRRLDRTAMAAAAAQFLGTHDFASFCKTRSLHTDSNVCEVDLCTFQWQDDSAIFHVRANRFLHHMVRNMVGTLYEVGRSRRPPAEISIILAERKRQRAGRTAPAHGLYLEEVTYPPELLDPAHRLQGPSTGYEPDQAREGDMA